MSGFSVLGRFISAGSPRRERAITSGTAPRRGYRPPVSSDGWNGACRRCWVSRGSQIPWAFKPRPRGGEVA